MTENLLSNLDQTIFYLAAHGKSLSEIAEVVSRSPDSVKRLIGSDRGQFEIKRARTKLFPTEVKDIKKQFDALVPKALEALRELADDPHLKPQLRFSVAQEILDRSVGKAKQTVEVQGSLIAEVFEKMDSLTPSEIKEVIDITPSQNYTDALPLPVNNLEGDAPKPASDVDEWISKNL